MLALLRAWDAAPEEPEPLVLRTSGSTGRPKSVVLSRAALRASAHATHDRLGGAGQWVLNLPPTYVAGLQVLFRSVVAGTDPVLQTGSLAETVAEMTGPRRHVSLVPTQLRRLLDDPAELAALARFDAVLVGGGPLRPEVRATAETAGVRVVQTYGMAETCGGCVYDGHPLDGVEVRTGGDGQVLLRGSVLFDGYADDPDRTATVMDDGWLRTQDLGRLDEDGRLWILGRADSVVISGGVNVPAEAVEAMIEQHPEVEDVVVVGVPDEEWGERVTAVVAARRPLGLAELRDLVEPRAWAPRALVATDAMPHLPNGKVDRRAARALADQQVRP
ncbi:AMP-binding protein [Nocardioides sp. HDW12B]|nr:AMP-binding protein [Nocardioides sp. HDW12B]